MSSGKDVSEYSLTENGYISIGVIAAIGVGICAGILLLALIFSYYFKKSGCKTENNRCHAVRSTQSRLSFAWISNRISRRNSKSRPHFHHNVIKAKALAEFVSRASVIYQEFREAPRVKAHKERVPKGCEMKNRYVNVFPIEETRVRLQLKNNDETTGYINANYVMALNEAPNYYIACQAPLESTVEDFWRMIWEQDSHVIIQATNLIENGKAMCAEYLPNSDTLESHITFGDFQVLIENREAQAKYTISMVYLSNTVENTYRKITHYWYNWPEAGVPTEQDSLISMLLKARFSLKTYAHDMERELKEMGIQCKKEFALYQGPLTVHCSSGTGRTGTIIACDMAIQSIETLGNIDLPKILYDIRRQRAKAVSTREQYEFIYKAAFHYNLKYANFCKVDIE